jgi:hypothetical protein
MSRLAPKTVATKQVVLYVRHEFDIPASVQKASLEETEEMIVIGSSVQQMIRARRSSNEIQKITELKDAEIQRIQASYQERLTKLLDDLQTVSIEKERMTIDYSAKLKEAQQLEHDHVSREYEERMRLLRKDHDVLLSKYSALEAARRVLEEAREKDIQSAIQRTEDIMEKVIQSKESELQRMQSAYHKLSESIARQSEELGKLAGSLGKRAANAKTKGSDYEEQFGEKLKKYFGICPGFRLRDTRLGAGHEMDFLMEMEGRFVMWELKNYSAVVPKAEVEKFLRDLKENPQVSIGVMISRSTDIYGKHQTGSLLTEFDGNKMMIYISQFEAFCGEEEGRVFQWLTGLFRIWWEYHKEENHLFDRVELLREIEKGAEEMGRRRTEWRRHKAHLDELGRWTADLLDDVEARWDRLLMRTRSDSAAADSSSSSIKAIPADVFRESKEERDQQWVQSILTVCEAGGEIEVRELVDLLSKYHRLSKDTIRSNVMSVIMDSAVFRKGVIKYVRGISKIVPPCEISLQSS